ncbi:MAG: dTDP-4-dehydrorhamnose reductase [Verrucomicrobiota bacterium]
MSSHGENKSLAWITGANGLIGNYLVQTAPRFAPRWRVRAVMREQFDLLDFAAVRREFLKDQPQLVIHCAALTHTPTCQENPALTRKLNVEVTALLTELTAEIPFFLFSTDLVFDGRTGNYDEAAPINPLTVYAETKAAAEQIVLANPKHTVIRTSLNLGTSPTGDRAFNEQLRTAVERGETLKLFTDEFRCPLPAEVMARAVWELAAQNKPGLYHVAGSERLSRWEIGQLLAKHWAQLCPKIEAASIRDFRGLPRSPDSSLNCAKVQKLLSFPLPRLSDWLAAHPDKLR